MDISDTLAPKSDQLDAVDLLSGPRTFTVEKVTRGNDEQPVNVHLAEFPRVWRPGKSMRRVLASVWGSDASAWVGRRVRLYCDPAVEYGGAAVGGTRIEAVSHIDKPRQVPLLVKRGRSAMFTVQPLPDEPAPKPAGPSLFDALKSAGLSDKDAALAYIGDVLGREVATTKELTPAEVQQIIDALAADFTEPEGD